MDLIPFTGSSTGPHQLSGMNRNPIRNATPKLISISSLQMVQRNQNIQQFSNLTPDGGCNYARRCVARPS
jgi:hypothetical protein